MFIVNRTGKNLKNDNDKKTVKNISFFFYVVFKRNNFIFQKRW